MSRPLHIAMLSSDAWPLVGGIASHVAGLSKALRTLGHTVTLIKPRIVQAFTAPSVLESPSGPVHDVPVPRVPGFSHWIYTRRVQHYLRTLCRETPPDLLHWHTLFLDGEVAARFPAWPRVFTNHSSEFLEMMSDVGRHGEARARLAPADWIITPSEELSDTTRAAGFPPDRVTTIPNGVNTTRFRPGLDRAPMRQRHGIPADAFVFLCARRLERKNGVRYWAEAVRLLLREEPDAHYLFVGDHPRSADSDHAVIESTLAAVPGQHRLHWAGSVPNADMPLYLAASDAAVLPSLREATSIAGLEAMACGLPLLGTEVGGIPEIVDVGETGLLVPAADPGALAMAALRLMRDRAETRRMGGAARRATEQRFSWEAIARRTVEIYAQARAAHAGGAPCAA